MTNNIKAQVFAKYLNQKVTIEYSNVSYIDTLTPSYTLIGVNKYEVSLQSDTGVHLWYSLDAKIWPEKMKGMYLLLRSISMLKDEEIENFCKMAGYLSTDTIEDWREQYESLLSDPELDEVTWKQVDYLRTRC